MRASLLITGLIVMGILAGCACNTTSLVEQEWGTAYKLAFRCVPLAMPVRGC